MTDDRLIDLHLAELLDRTLRFHLHLNEVDEEFYNDGSSVDSGNRPTDKPLLIQSFRQCIHKLIEVVARLGASRAQLLAEGKTNPVMCIIKDAFVTLNQLHEFGLINLPRPTEPIELRRFCRIISRHVLNRKRDDVIVYVTEATAEGAFAADPLSAVRTNRFRGLTENATNVIGGASIDPLKIEGAGAIHVTVGRIDARNPVRWPSLLHEAGHKLLSSKEFSGQSLEERFKQATPEAVFTEIAALPITLNAWLTELWCDLFAALVMGPAFFFSQFSAFMASPPHEATLSPDYPPHGFRLRLIEMFLRHRYEEQSQHISIKAHRRDCIELVEYWDKYWRIDIFSHASLKTVFDAARVFFQEHFFSGTASEAENFQLKFRKMVKYVHDIRPESLEYLQQQLADGLPIPARRKRDTDVQSEKPTSVQEVLLTAWLDRLTRLREENFNAIRGPNETEMATRIQSILEILCRSDDATLRSLQLAEWLHLLNPKKPARLNKPKLSLDAVKRTNGFLCDEAIHFLLANDSLRIIPLVDLDQQLGSTSIDLRLGTSFQIYLPACRRSQNVGSSTFDLFDSRRIDLDYLEHVVLLPGHFMLAHSFEYLKLPAWLGGELDGRSSYARLGLEVHMTAGMIDPGFEGVVTFELSNMGPNPIHLFPGLRIAQLRFTVVSEPSRPYSKRHTAKYRGLLQHNTSLYKNDPDFKKITAEINRASTAKRARRSQPNGIQ